MFLLCRNCRELSGSWLARRGNLINLVDPNQLVRSVVVEVGRTGQGPLRFNFILVQVVAPPYKVQGFVWLYHQLLVGFGQVFGFDNHDLLLFELHIATGSDDDPVLAWVVLLASFLALVQLLFKLEVGQGLLFKLWEVKRVLFVGRRPDFCLDQSQQLFGPVVKFFLSFDLFLEGVGDVFNSLDELS